MNRLGIWLVLAAIGWIMLTGFAWAGYQLYRTLHLIGLM